MVGMTKITRTIKLKFVDLNRCKAQMFEQMTEENTRIANNLLSLPIKERRKMTTAKIMSELKSALVNQVIRHTTSGQSRHNWSYYSLEQKLNYKLALKGLKLIKRPAPYTSKSCSTCGVIGKRNRHDFNCPNGHYHNSDLNAARNLSQWDGFSCDLNLKRDASVMDSSGLNYGVLGTPLNSMNTGKQEYIQLSLFDWARYENPTPFA